MILLLSHASNEDSTQHVMDWLSYKKADHLRVNGKDLKEQNLEFILSNEDHICNLELDGHNTSFDHVDTVWFRRWTWNNKGYGEKSPLEKATADLGTQLSNNIKNHLFREFQILSGSFYDFFKEKPWLSHPAFISPNKIKTLNKAKKLGINIPTTLITNRKHILQDFKNKQGRIITKPIKDTMTFEYNKVSSNIFTAEVSQEDIDQSNDIFYPSLFQTLIEKEYELRVFYLDGQCYSMAIFSQSDQQTTVDFRVYNADKPNRNVPYKIPKELETKLGLLMEELKCGTGSIDIIKSKQGEYIFLEVNPVGQLGMTSVPCNYHLEEKIADYLIKLSNARKN